MDHRHSKSSLQRLTDGQLGRLFNTVSKVLAADDSDHERREALTTLDQIKREQIRRRCVARPGR